MSQSTWDIIVGGSAPGGSKVQAIEDALKACTSCHSGTSRPSYAVAGTLWYDTSAGTWYLYDGSSDVAIPTSAVNFAEGTFTDGDTTPSVSSQKTIYKTANTSATTITTFDDGSAGQFFILLCNDANTTVDGALTKCGKDVALASGDMLLYSYTGSGWKQIGGTVGMDELDLDTLPVNDATPSVQGITSAKVANTSATTITAWDDATAGQRLSVVFTDSNTTLDGGLTATGMDIPTQAGDTWEGIYDGSSWQQIGGSIGMGRFVPVIPPDEVGDWISSSTTSFTDVDVSDDGVRKGANAVTLIFECHTSGSTEIILFLRPNGRSEVKKVTRSGWGGSAQGLCEQLWVALDNNAKFEGKFYSSFTATENKVTVIGYYI